MEVETFAMIALIVGVLLMIAEAVLPGGIAFSVGLSTVAIGVAYQFGIVSAPFNVFITWSLLSLLFSSIGMVVISKFFSGESVQQFVDEDDGIYGKTAEVIEDISRDKGRVHFRGTAWQAISLGKKYRKGERVTVVSRDNLTLIVDADEKNSLS